MSEEKKIAALRWITAGGSGDDGDGHTGSCTTDAMDRAARNGHLQTVKWLYDAGDDICDRERPVKWLHDNRPECCVSFAS